MFIVLFFFYDDVEYAQIDYVGSENDLYDIENITPIDKIDKEENDLENPEQENTEFDYFSKGTICFLLLI